MQFKKSDDEEPRLGITPLIDIVFLLLIFFMLTSHFDVATGVRIRLPKARQKIYGTREENLKLLIDRNGHAYLKGEALDKKKLFGKLQDLVNKKGLGRIILQADKDTAHGKVVEIMDLAKSAGVQTIIIAARWETQEEL